MKLGEALRERADLQKEISALSARLAATARYLEGETPQENAADTLAQARASIARFHLLVKDINTTNAATVVDGVTITALLARRDALAGERKLLTEAADAAAGTRRSDLMFVARRRTTELREVPALHVLELRGEADRLAAQLRELDVRIQQANWDTDLL